MSSQNQQQQHQQLPTVQPQSECLVSVSPTQDQRWRLHQDALLRHLQPIHDSRIVVIYGTAGMRANVRSNGCSIQSWRLQQQPERPTVHPQIECLVYVRPNPRQRRGLNRDALQRNLQLVHESRILVIYGTAGMRAYVRSSGTETLIERQPLVEVPMMQLLRLEQPSNIELSSPVIIRALCLNPQQLVNNRVLLVSTATGLEMHMDANSSVRVVRGSELLRPTDEAILRIVQLQQQQRQQQPQACVPGSSAAQPIRSSRRTQSPMTRSRSGAELSRQNQLQVDHQVRPGTSTGAETQNAVGSYAAQPIRSSRRTQSPMTRSRTGTELLRQLLVDDLVLPGTSTGAETQNAVGSYASQPISGRQGTRPRIFKSRPRIERSGSSEMVSVDRQQPGTSTGAETQNAVGSYASQPISGRQGTRPRIFKSRPRIERSGSSEMVSVDRQQPGTSTGAETQPTRWNKRLRIRMDSRNTWTVNEESKTPPGTPPNAPPRI